MSDFNREQLEHWNGPGGQRWVSEQDRLDRVLAPLSAAVLAAAAPQPGERVIDVGCGCGASTIELAERVGASGHVLGVDISAPMLARARQRLQTRSWVQLEQADAASYGFAGNANLLFSRFGVMFFGEPELAFANLRRALAPGGRLCVVCWRTFDENPWLALPARAAESVLGASSPPPAGAPGPFSLASSKHTRALLERAGFSSVALSPLDLTLELSTTGLDDAVAFVEQTGPLSRMLLQIADDQDKVARVMAAVRAMLAAHMTGQRLALTSAAWILSANG
jgi:SAM-dependent methyltransferase